MTPLEQARDALVEAARNYIGGVATRGDLERALDAFDVALATQPPPVTTEPCGCLSMGGKRVGFCSVAHYPLPPAQPTPGNISHICLWEGDKPCPSCGSKLAARYAGRLGADFDEDLGGGT